MFQRKEQTIREQRTIEAMKNGLMGSEGKICRVAKVFGHPIYKQCGSNFEQTFMEDPWELEEDEIPTMDEEEISHQIGWHFDGMRQGLHMEILWNEEYRELKAYYNSVLVYREVGGELDGYIPHEEWQSKLEVLFEKAKKKERINKKEHAVVVGLEAKRQQQEFLEAMRRKWGI